MLINTTFATAIPKSNPFILNNIGPIITINTQPRAKDKSVPESALRIIIRNNNSKNNKQRRGKTGNNEFFFMRQQ
jgi:hypothetical protein